MAKPKLKYQVIHSLHAKPELANSDISLMIYIWRRYHGVDGDSIRLSKLYDLPTQESIKRIRAQLNSVGEYLPTDPKVLEARGLLEKQVRKELGYTGPPMQRAIATNKELEKQQARAISQKPELQTLFNIPPEVPKREYGRGH